MKKSISNSAMRGRLFIMLAGTSMLIAMPALAQSAGANAPEEAADDARPKSPSNPEEIVVTGTRRVSGGLMKVQVAPEAISSITGAAIQEKLPAAGPLQLVATMPGVNTGSTDAYGLSIRNFISVRGLDQSEIGYLVDNMPGLDIRGYFPYSELWVDNENIADISLTPGNSRLQDPIINASGGEMIVTVRDPSDNFGGRLSGAIGSFKARRGFGRIDTGTIGETGFKAFGSYSRTAADNYVGPGRNHKDQFDFKAVEDWGNGSKSSLFVSHAILHNARIPALNLTQATDGIATTLEKYQNASTFVPGTTTNYFKSNFYDRRTWMVANNNDIVLSDAITLHVTPYYKHTYDAGIGGLGVAPTSLFRGNQNVTAVFDPALLQNGRIFANNVTRYYQNQYGLNTWLEADLSDTNHLMFGFWHETWKTHVFAALTVLDRQGEPLCKDTSCVLRTATGALVTGVDYRLKTQTNQLFIGDTQSFLDDRLKVSLGFKQLFWKLTGEDTVPGVPVPNIRVNVSKPMPRILVSFDASPQSQVYANVTTNARMPNAAGTYVTTYNVSTGRTINLGNFSVKPEYTVSTQLGYRYNGAFNFDANVFYMHLSNHQITSQILVNNVLFSSPISAGGEEITGAAFELSSHSYGGFSGYVSGQYLRGKLEDNIAVGANILPTKGKDMVQSPKWSGNAGIRFERGGFFALVTGKYTSSQFATFMNDERMPRTKLFDFGMGYKFPDIGPAKSPTLRLNVTNIGNKPYIASISGFTANAKPTVALNGVTVAGSAPLYYVGAPRAVMLSFSSDF